MKAYLIDPVAKTVTEVETTGRFDGPDGVYQHTKCGQVESFPLNREGDHVYMDEEATYNGALHKYGAFVVTHGDQSRPFIGYGLVLGDSGHGHERAPRISLADMEKMVSFPSLDELRRNAAAGIYDR